MKRIYIISFLLTILLQHTLAQNPFITNYTIKDGLPSNKVFCVFQDSKNFMWFGTDAGLIRFDGNQFVQYSDEDGLSGNVVRIKEAYNGQIWFLNLNGTVNFFYNNQIYNTLNAPFLAELKTNFFFHNLFQDTDSTLYFYNQASEIYVVKNNEYVDYQNYNKSPSNIPISTHFLNKGSTNHFQVWTNEGILELKDINHLTKRHNTASIIQKAFPIGENRTFVLDQFRDVHLFQNTELIKKKVFHCESQNINDIVVDDEDVIWVSTFDKGIYCYKNGKLYRHLNIKKTTNLILDDENNLWTASSINGIFKINRDILKYKVLEKDAFDNEGITKLTPANNGGVWATNGQSLFWINKQKKFNRKLSTGPYILENIYQLQDNTIIVGGNGTNLHFIENVRVDTLNNTIRTGELSRKPYIAKDIAVDSTERQFYSFIQNQLMVGQRQKETNIKFVQINRGRITNVFINNKNQVIVNAKKNYIYENQTIRNATVYKQFDGNIISTNFILDKQNEVLNIDRKELYLLHNEKLYGLTDKFSSQIDYGIRDIAYDGNTLFFFTIKTVYFISNPLEILSGKELELSRLNIEFNNINDILCQDSTLYVASDDGLTFIPIKDCTNSQLQATLPYFTSVSLNDKNYDLSSKLVEFKNKKRLSIEFSSLNYSSIPTEYSYQLKGVDQSWINGHETRVVYSNLSPGKYTFQLKSRKSREPFSELIELPVNVKPTLFQRTSTRLFLLFFTIFVIYLIVRFLYRRKLKQKEIDHTLITLEHKALQSMMNPHFIFNALGSIQGFLLQNKSSEAGTYLSQFARLIRQNMNSLKSNYICIDEEVERLRNYIDLEKLRMNNCFDFEIIVDEELDSYEVCIPSMIIQPFVENAIWHGISSLNDGGKITVVFNHIDEKSIEVLVEDNGVGIKDSDQLSKPGSGLNMGMTLTKKRLRLIGERQGVNSKVRSKNLLPNNEFPGTQINIIIPTVDGES